VKIRNGFVSNSSSSSFVVAFPKQPKTKKMLREMLFGDAKYFANPYDFNHTCHGWPIEQVVNAIWEQISSQTANNKKAILEGFNGWFDGRPDYDDFKIDDGTLCGDTDWDKYHEASSIARQKKMKEFMKANPLHYVYVFEFGDEDGEFFCALEHGDTFHNVPHEVISRH
jgi:hypothetical protein